MRYETCLSVSDLQNLHDITQKYILYIKTGNESNWDMPQGGLLHQNDGR